MFRKMILLNIIISLLLVSCFCSITFAEELIQVPVIIHISSNVSDGKLTIAEITRIAKQAGVKAIIFNDHDYVSWEYGVWPLRNIFKKTVTFLIT